MSAPSPATPQTPEPYHARIGSRGQIDPTPLMAAARLLVCLFFPRPPNHLY
jgi:hypothetical protein